MPTVRYEGAALECAEGERLREVLLRHGLTPHNGNARWLNCKGLGTCGTCAMEVRGPVTPPTAVERWRLSFPPHVPESGLRLTCQVRVLGDVELVKHPGFWGQHVPGLKTPEQGSTEPRARACVAHP